MKIHPKIDGIFDLENGNQKGLVQFFKGFKKLHKLLKIWKEEVDHDK